MSRWMNGYRQMDRLMERCDGKTKENKKQMKSEINTQNKIMLISIMQIKNE